MKCLRVATIALLLVFHLTCAFAIDRPLQFDKPEEVVAWLYRDFGWECFLAHYFEKDILINQPKSVLEQYFVLGLSDLIVRDRAFERRTKELGHIDFVLLFGSQDTDGVCNLRIKRTPDTNKVMVLYDQNGQRDIMEMQFDTVQTNKGLRISDIHYKLRKSDISSEKRFSLQELLSQPYEQKTDLPTGWRYPSAEELSDELGRKDSPTKYTKAVTDFNGDGIDDEAYLLKSTTFSGEGLLVRLSDKQKGFRWVTLATIDWGKEYPKVNLSMGVDIAKPGEYKTACGKGYWACEKGEPAVLKLKRPAIDYFKFESANSFFYWDDKTNRFKRIWMSD